MVNVIAKERLPPCTPPQRRMQPASLADLRRPSSGPFTMSSDNTDPSPPGTSDTSLTERAAEEQQGNTAAAPPTPSLRSAFPALFAGRPKPLKLRIQLDIQQRAPGMFTRQQLTQLLRRHTGHHAYLSALGSEGSRRFDLDGNDAGPVSEEHRKAAIDELARRRTAHRERQALADEQRRNRGMLLRDFERTTLTPTNFAALKGLDVAELESLVSIAREEAKTRQAPPSRHGRRAPPNDPRQPRRNGPKNDAGDRSFQRSTLSPAQPRVTPEADTESPGK